MKRRSPNSNSHIDELANLRARLTSAQRRQLDSYETHVLRGSLTYTAWSKWSGVGTARHVWGDWCKQSDFATALALTAAQVERERLEKQQQEANAKAEAESKKLREIAEAEAEAKYKMALLKAEAIKKLTELLKPEAPSREAVQAAKLVLDYDTTPPVAASDAAEAFRQASVPLDDEVTNGNGNPTE